MASSIETVGFLTDSGSGVTFLAQSAETAVQIQLILNGSDLIVCSYICIRQVSPVVHDVLRAWSARLSDVFSSTQAHRNNVSRGMLARQLSSLLSINNKLK